MVPFSLIVMEPGSAWPGHVEGCQNVVTVGAGDERLLPRIRRKLDLLGRRGERVEVAVLACNDATDSLSVARRAALARELLSAVAPGGIGKLVLSAAGRASSQVRDALLDLAGALTLAPRGDSALISVKFSEPC